MTVTADGHVFTTYIEGVRVPALNIVMDVAPMVTTVNMGIFAHESAKAIKDGSLLAMFYTKSGLKESRLLFFGFLKSRSYSKVNGMHTVTLVFVSRMAFLSRLQTSISGGSTYTSCITQKVSEVTTGESQSRIARQSLGGGEATNVVVTVKDGDLPANTPGTEASLFKDGFTVNRPEQHVVDSTDEKTVEDGKTALHPFGKVTEGVEYQYPVKSIMDKIIDETCTTSGVFNRIAYEDRYLLKDYISELPGGWTEYFFGEGTLGTKGKNTNKSKFLTVFSRYLEQLGSSASVTDIFVTLASLVMAETYEIPGLVDGAQQIVPESIHSDIPMCNVIWPDMCKSVVYNEDSSRRISRLIFMGPASDEKTQGTALPSNSAASSTALGMYPLTAEILADKDKTIAMNYNNIVYETEVYNGTSLEASKFPLTYLALLDATLLSDLAKYSYINSSTRYSTCNVSCHFLPEVIPGINAVVNDGMWKGVGKVMHMRHVASPDGIASTDIQLSNFKKLEDYEYTIPTWYSDRYYPENIDDLYYTKYGVNSIGGFLDNEGLNLEALVEALTEMYESTSVKSYMAGKLSQRHFVSQEQFFTEIFNCTVAQQDGKGPVIYTGKVFDAVRYDAYTIDGELLTGEAAPIADRQQAVVDYLKATYGRPAVKV